MRKLFTSVVAFAFALIVAAQLFGATVALADTSQTVSFGYTSGNGYTTAGTKTTSSATASTLYCYGLVVTQTGSTPPAYNYFNTALAVKLSTGSFSYTNSTSVKTELLSTVSVKNTDSGIGSTVRFVLLPLDSNSYTAYVTYNYK